MSLAVWCTLRCYQSKRADSWLFSSSWREAADASRGGIRRLAAAVAALALEHGVVSNPRPSNARRESDLRTAELPSYLRLTFSSGWSLIGQVNPSPGS